MVFKLVILGTCKEGQSKTKKDEGGNVIAS